MYWKVSESEAHWFMQAIHGGDGEIRRRGFFKDVMKLPVDFEVWELAPGVSEGMHVHDGETMLEELYYFLEGEGVMWVDGERVPIAAGDAVLAPAASDHGFKNTGSGPLRLVLVWGRPKA